MELIPLKSPLIKPKDDLTEILSGLFEKRKIELQEKDILVVSSKVVALSENRIVDLSEITVTDEARKIKDAKYVQSLGKKSDAFKQLVLNEADEFLDGSMVYLTLKNKILIPHAGIDLSNAPEGIAILWPENSFESAEKIRDYFLQKFSLKELGVLVIDSHCQPLRAGVVGIALGWSGIEGVEDERGKKDLYGKELRVTQKNSADQLASAASLLMGEAGESIPFVLVKNAPVRFSSKKFDQESYAFDVKEDLFAGIYNNELKTFSGKTTLQ